MKDVYYFGYYSVPDAADEGRAVYPAAHTVMRYVAQTAAKNGCSVKIVSLLRTGKPGRYAGKTYRDGDLTVCTLPTVYRRGFFGKIYRNLFFYFTLFGALLRVPRSATVLFYHAAAGTRAAFAARFFKRFRLVLQVCELYAEQKEKPRRAARECRMLRGADAYILIHSALAARILPDAGEKDPHGRVKRPLHDVCPRVSHAEKRPPFAVCSGVYRTEKRREVPAFADGKIHVLYAGTLDPRKGVPLALETARFLPENYVLHILGFGSPEDRAALLARLEDVNRSSACRAVYEGVLQGEDLIRFMQRCRVGLCTQATETAFGGSSFPSKIFSYLANGLQVVSAPIGVVKHSPAASLLHFYDEPTPKKIAEAVEAAAANPKETSLGSLDGAFTEEVGRLL